MSCIVLSGGGVYGVLLLGALHCKIEQIPDIKLFAGTSAGAIIVTLLSIGYTCAEILKEIKENMPIIQTDSFKITNLFERFGLFTNEKMLTLVKSMIIKKINYIPTFAELYNTLHIDLIITGTNLSQQIPVYFQRKYSPNMLIIDALEISCCLPLIFPFVLHENDMYIDGMFVDNFPTLYARQYATEHISPITKVDINIHGFTIEYIPNSSPNSLFSYIECIIKFIIHMLHTKQNVSVHDTEKKMNIYRLKTDRNISLTTSNVYDIDILFQEGIINILKNQNS
jgi:predicted acylesterase/phospholipase RssA